MPLDDLRISMRARYPTQRSKFILSAPESASVCAILAGEKEIIPGPPSLEQCLGLGLGDGVFPTLSNFKRTSLFHQFWWFLWQSCDYRVTNELDQRSKLTNQHIFGIMSHQCLLETKQKVGDLLGQYDARILIFEKKRFTGQRCCKGNDPRVVWDIFDLNHIFLFKWSKYCHDSSKPDRNIETASISPVSRHQNTGGR